MRLSRGEQLLLGAAAAAALLLFASSAHAADFAPIPAPVFDWTGLYIGGAGGWGVDDQVEFKVREEPFFHDEHNLEGAVFGGQAGARYMWTTGGSANLVGGIEFQGFASDINGDNEINILGPYAKKLHTGASVDDLLLAKAKLGFSIDRWWLYGTLGWASASLSPHASLNLGDIYVPVEECTKECGGGGAAKFSWEDDRNQNGVVFGAGVNYAITDNIIVGAEWNHIDLPDVTFSGPVKFAGYNLFPVHAQSDFGIDVVMGTISFNWGGGAMVAPQ